MRCKPNEPAFLIKAVPSLEFAIGRIVTPISFHDGEWDLKIPDDLMKKVKSILPWATSTCAPDDHLFPIRPGESPEQSLEAMRDLMQTKKEKVTT